MKNILFLSLLFANYELNAIKKDLFVGIFKEISPLIQINVLGSASYNDNFDELDIKMSFMYGKTISFGPCFSFGKKNKIGLQAICKASENILIVGSFDVYPKKTASLSLLWKINKMFLIGGGASYNLSFDKNSAVEISSKKTNISENKKSVASTLVTAAPASTANAVKIDCKSSAPTPNLNSNSVPTPTPDSTSNVVKSDGKNLAPVADSDSNLNLNLNLNSNSAPVPTPASNLNSNSVPAPASTANVVKSPEEIEAEFISTLTPQEQEKYEQYKKARQIELKKASREQFMGKNFTHVSLLHRTDIGERLEEVRGVMQMIKGDKDVKNYISFESYGSTASEIRAFLMICMGCSLEGLTEDQRKNFTSCVYNCFTRDYLMQYLIQKLDGDNFECFKVFAHSKPLAYERRMFDFDVFSDLSIPEIGLFTFNIMSFLAQDSRYKEKMEQLKLIFKGLYNENGEFTDDMVGEANAVVIEKLQAFDFGVFENNDLDLSDIVEKNKKVIEWGFDYYSNVLERIKNIKQSTPSQLLEDPERLEEYVMRYYYLYCNNLSFIRLLDTMPYVSGFSTSFKEEDGIVNVFRSYAMELTQRYQCSRVLRVALTERIYDIIGYEKVKNYIVDDYYLDLERLIVDGVLERGETLTKMVLILLVFNYCMVGGNELLQQKHTDFKSWKAFYDAHIEKFKKEFDKIDC